MISLAYTRGDMISYSKIDSGHHEPKPQLSYKPDWHGFLLSLILASCGGRGEASLPVDNGGNGDGGGQAREGESIPNIISDIRAEKMDI
jgi:hypothetical protein